MTTPMTIKAILFVSLLLGTITGSYACACQEEAYAPSMSEKFMTVNHQVFTAKVLKIKTAKKTKKRRYPFLKVRVEVTQIYNGELKRKKVWIKTGISRIACGVSFREGHDYFIVAQQDDFSKYLLTSICTPTRLLAVAKKEIEFIEAQTK